VPSFASVDDARCPKCLKQQIIEVGEVYHLGSYQYLPVECYACGYQYPFILGPYFEPGVLSQIMKSPSHTSITTILSHDEYTKNISSHSSRKNRGNTSFSLAVTQIPSPYREFDKYTTPYDLPSYSRELEASLKRPYQVTIILPQFVESFRSRVLIVPHDDLPPTIHVHVKKPEKLQDPRLHWHEHVHGEEIQVYSFHAHRVHGTVYVVPSSGQEAP